MRPSLPPFDRLGLGAPVERSIALRDERPSGPNSQTMWCPQFGPQQNPMKALLNRDEGHLVHLDSRPSKVSRPNPGFGGLAHCQMSRVPTALPSRIPAQLEAGHSQASPWHWPLQVGSNFAHSPWRSAMTQSFGATMRTKPLGDGCRSYSSNPKPLPTGRGTTTTDGFVREERGDFARPWV